MGACGLEGPTSILEARPSMNLKVPTTFSFQDLPASHSP
jgi:hypothetical protein